MLTTKIRTQIIQLGRWRVANAILATAVFALVLLFLLLLAIPVRLQPNTVTISNDTNLALTETLNRVLQNDVSNIKQFPKRIRTSLFKAPTPLRDKPLADKTIERIRSQLKLQCIMEIGGQRVAYVYIKGAGLKKCKAGDSIRDLFTVLNVETNNIEISIVGHKTTLSL